MRPWRRCRTSGLGEPAPTAAPALATPAGRRSAALRPVRPTNRFRTSSSGRPIQTPLTAAGLVQLPTGSGALVAARPSPGTPGTTVYLVTDTGMRYPVAGQRTLEQLGLAGVASRNCPQRWSDLLPLGPLLDPAAAALPVS